MRVIALIQFLILLNYTSMGQNWTSYTSENGLASNNISDIAIDHNNIKWFGTWGSGVSKFDGTNWVTYDTNSGLRGNFINSIAIDAQNNKWFGTGYVVFGGSAKAVEAGVSKFDGTHWSTYLERNWYDMVFDIAVDSLDNIWCGTAAGLKKYDHSNWTDFNGPDSVGSISIDTDTSIWTYGNRLYNFNGINWTLRDIWQGFGICVDRDGNLWFSAVNYLGKFNGITWEDHQNNDIGYPSKALVMDKNNNAWMGTSNGAFRFDGLNWTHYTTQDGLISNKVNSIAIDEENNIWFGTDEGVSKYGEIDTIILDTKIISQNKNVLSIYPIPTTISVNIEFPSRDNYALTVSKIDGSIVRKINEFSSQESVLSTRDLDAGIYLLTVKSITSGKIYNGKIIVTNK